MFGLWDFLVIVCVAPFIYRAYTYSIDRSKEEVTFVKNKCNPKCNNCKCDK